MIDIEVKIHDKFSIEFKIGFLVHPLLRQNDFAINTWIFVPNSLDMNPITYTKTQFYSDVKSNVRLITPIFLLRDLADPAAVPLSSLREAFEILATDPSRTNIGEYEYKIKMFSSIFKSALRDEYKHIVTRIEDDDLEYLCNSYIDNVRAITSAYRELRRTINVPTISDDVQNYFMFGDEFIGNIIEQHTFKLIEILKKQHNDKLQPLISKLVELAKYEKNYKIEKGYLTIDRSSKNSNRDLIFRYGVLKKYVESDLFLRARRKRDGAVVEQVYYSLAAGLSMVFATAIAFSFQQKYGNFTMPLFVALVVSYMLKDRIKDLMRYYFAHRLGAKYFDNKTTISVKDTPIGWIKEGMDFITEDKAPKEVMSIRSRSPLVEAENRATDEKIILYRKLVRIDGEQLDQNSEYQIAGINDIIRLHVNRFVQKMDNPQVELYDFDDHDNVDVISGDKIYYMNIVMQLQHDDQTDYKRFRLVFNRLGIAGIEEMR